MTVLYGMLEIPLGILGCLFLVGLGSTPAGSPVMMSVAQCVMLARSAARAERTETQKETKSLARREYSISFFSIWLWLLLRCSDCL